MTSTHLSFLRERILKLLERWVHWAEGYWFNLPDYPLLGYWGTGYNHWGVQTNQKYLAAVATLSSQPEISPYLQEKLRQHALSALRFSLQTHVSGTLYCMDGTSWGHTWISTLGIERMMHGVSCLQPFLSEEDLSILSRVLISEADWLIFSHERNGYKGISASKWENGKNHPESNLWNGAFLWRVAKLYPNHPHASEWEEYAHQFLLNGVSIEADQIDTHLVEGKPVCVRHIGANFFDHYALDHHGYMNVGYMVICVSNAAILYFDCLDRNLPIPQTLHHHQKELWNVLRNMIFPDGRLLRIGGDSRIRYTYCQEYLLPALLYVAHYHQDPQVYPLLHGLIQLMEKESQTPPADGRFYSQRLQTLEQENPYYYLRLESDRANVLGMFLAWYPFLLNSFSNHLSSEKQKQENVIWIEPEHGDVLVRGPKRIASFSWKAYGLTQGLCLPPDGSDLAEWWQNMVSVIRFMGDPYPYGPPSPGSIFRKILHFSLVPIQDRGFITTGRILEGTQFSIPEGLKLENLAHHDLIWIALPDGQTVIGIEMIRILEKKVYILKLKGIHLNIVNDLYNEFKRQIYSEAGVLCLSSPPQQNEWLSIASPWINIDQRLGVLLLNDCSDFYISRSARPRGGYYPNLYVEECCSPCKLCTFPAEPQEIVLDLAWATIASVSSKETQAIYQHYRSLTTSLCSHSGTSQLSKKIYFPGCDGQIYRIDASFDPNHPPSVILD